MTLTISIDRTDMSLTPLVMSADTSADAIGIASYTEPALLVEISYGDASGNYDGEYPLRWRRPNTFHRFDVITDLATTEAFSQAAMLALVAATSRLRYLTTVTIGNSVKVWTCFPASFSAPERTLNDVRDHDVLWTVTLPCHPTAT
jgi:hypothetical protein